MELFLRNTDYSTLILGVLLLDQIALVGVIEFRWRHRCGAEKYIRLATMECRCREMEYPPKIVRG